MGLAEGCKRSQEQFCGVQTARVDQSQRGSCRLVGDRSGQGIDIGAAAQRPGAGEMPHGRFPVFGIRRRRPIGQASLVRGPAIVQIVQQRRPPPNRPDRRSASPTPSPVRIVPARPAEARRRPSDRVAWLDFDRSPAPRHRLTKLHETSGIPGQGGGLIAVPGGRFQPASGQMRPAASSRAATTRSVSSCPCRWAQVAGPEQFHRLVQPSAGHSSLAAFYSKDQHR